jgi:hypothetical protein
MCRAKNLVMSPRRGSTPRLTGWLTVSRNVTLTLTRLQRVKADTEKAKGVRIRLDAKDRRKILCLCRESNRGHPVRRYTDLATPAPPKNSIKADTEKAKGWMCFSQGSNSCLLSMKQTLQALEAPACLVWNTRRSVLQKHFTESHRWKNTHHIRQNAI